MSKIIFALVFLITSYLGLRAQEFQGMAVYETKTSTSDFKARIEGNKNITPDMQKNHRGANEKNVRKNICFKFQ